MSIILGLDPGSRLAGIGVLKVDRDQIRHLFHGVIKASGEEVFPARISKMGLEFRSIL